MSYQLYTKNESGEIVAVAPGIDERVSTLETNKVDVREQTLTDEQKEQACNNLGLSEHVTKSWRSGTEWYRVWSDGTIEQGGRKDLAGAARSVTLHLPMSNSNYLACVSPRTNRGSWPLAWSNISSCTNTAIYLDGTGNGYVENPNRNIVIDWRVEGN